MNSTLVAHLTDLGLTRNEALAYLTLIEDGEGDGLTGYEVAARSGVPRSAVYTVLRKLEASGAAFSFGSDPARYVGTAPERLIEQHRRDTLSQLATTAEALSKLPARPRPEPVWIHSRYDEVMTRIDAMLRGAERSVYLSLWPREIARLASAFSAIAERDLHRVLHSPAFVPTPPPGFSLWAGSIINDKTKATWSHKALVVVDRREALIGGTEPEADNHAVRTTNPSLVDMATNHIILDITLMARERGRDCGGDVAPMMRPHIGRGD